MARRIKRGDMVAVITGADAGTMASPRTGRVLRVIHNKSDSNKDRVVVEGVNRVWKHVRPSQRNQQGGRIQMDAPIHVSNVMLLEPGSGKPTRVKFSMVDGEKHRTALRGGTDLGSTRKK
jgi:large subunit ribosomal protein L24